MPAPSPLRQHITPPIVRLRVTPAEGPPAIVEQRPPGSRRHHTDMVVLKVRHLIEHTDRAIGKSRQRPGSTTARSRAGRATANGSVRRTRRADMVPEWRASRRLKLRKLATRLEALAERCISELEEAPRVEVEMLMQALQVLKMARLEAMPRWGRGRRWTSPAVTGAWTAARAEAIRTALKEMRRGGVDLDRAPHEAVDMVVGANLPVDDNPALRPRGRRR